VLTATFNSYGDRQFQPPPPQNRYRWTDQQKSRHNWLCPREDPHTQYGTNPPTEGFWENGWNITKNYFLFILFSQVRVQVRPVNRFLRATAQKTWNHARMCLLGVWTMSPLNFGVKPPKKLKFWGREWDFQAWSTKNQILITWKLLSRSRQKFYKECGPWIRLRGWSHGSRQQIQDGGGRHLKFRKNVNNSGWDKDICTKYYGKMHHSHAEMTTWPKVETGS